ncbi:MAG: hypothetical protein SFY80_06465 [Verrucomicrobiota bacterium]|nr:hypothetical protein [Verrucomicrobiota bacterium]
MGNVWNIGGGRKDDQKPHNRPVQKVGLLYALFTSRYLIVTAIVALCVTTLVLFVTTKVQKATEAAAAAMQSFGQTEITQRFESYLTRIRNTGQGNLEVAIMDEMAILSRTEETRTFWGMLPGGKDYAEIRIPVTYRFYIKLEEDWSLAIKDRLLQVKCPELRASQPPAIHTQGMQKRIEGSWYSLNTQANMEQLEKSLTFALARKAPQKALLARDEARRTISEFVRHWVLDTKLGLPQDTIIQVYFPDETAPLPTAPVSQG